MVASAIITVLFFGGWQLPYYDIQQIGWAPIFPGVDFQIPWPSLIGAAVFGAKVSFFAVLQVVIRWTLPRFRYDQLMNLCWKLMLPISLVNVVLTVAALLYFGAP